MIVMMIGTLALYMGANAYIFWRLMQALGAMPATLRVVFGVLYWLAACGMFISFGLRNVAMPEFMHRVLHIVGTSWLLFTLYMFTDTKVTVSETGAFTVSTKVTAKDLKVFDSTSAVADGTVLAKVYQDNGMIGVVQLVLPTYGVGTYGATLEGICLVGAERGKPCTVKFAASNLWVMEA